MPHRTGTVSPAVALMRAAMRASEIRREQTGDQSFPPSVLRGAPSHSAAHLLQALDEQGWTLAPKDEIDQTALEALEER